MKPPEHRNGDQSGPDSLKPGEAFVKLGDMDDETIEKRLHEGLDVAHMASCVGHHVINAYAAVVSNAEILRVALGNPEKKLDKQALATTIIRTALDASDVARRLIDFARPLTDPGRDPIRLDLVLEDEFQRRRERPQSAGPKIEWRAELRAVPSFLGNEAYIRDMLDRLIQNSIEAGEGRESLTITTRLELDDRGWLVLDLEDTGAGMVPWVMERAVEPFFTTKPGRLGVGLSIANRIWRRHRGTLSVASTPGRGTKLRLCTDPNRSAQDPFGV